MRLFENSVIVCTGSGGVGKTTLSASLGVMAARAGKKVLILTIDPARRLATALGIKDGSDIVLVPNQDFSGELYAGKIDSAEVFKQFILDSAPSGSAVEKILSNNLYKQLSTTLSGSQEFTSLVKLYNEFRSEKYDLIILDTPPTQHAIDFLQSPEKIYTLFQSSITKWFVQNKESQASLWNKLVHKGTQAVLSVFQKVTGSDFMEELSDFFVSLKDLQENISATCMGTQNLLKQDKTAFVLVTSFDQAKIMEAKSYYSQLTDGGFDLDTVLINRAYPRWVEKQEQVGASLQEQYIAHRDYYIRRAQSYDEFQKDFSGKLNVVKLPEFDVELSGLDGLGHVADEVQRVTADSD